MIDIGV